MVNIVHLFLVTVSIFVVSVYCSLESILSDYYKSEELRSLTSEWRKYKTSYDNALAMLLRDNFGDKSMNVFVKQESSRRLTISKGFIFSDNVVNVLLFDMVLRDMPNLFMPEVSIELPSNLLKLEATVSKIFIDTSYYVARSDSTISYGSEKDLGKQSPFSLQQVQTYGKLVIIAEDCFLNGFAIVTLSAESVNVGHGTFHLNDCKFTAEISPHDFSLPPVIAPYFSKYTGRQIERLLSEPLLNQLMPKLQGAMYSYINTSKTIGEDLPKIRITQQKLFKKTANYLSELCVKLNNLTIKENGGRVQLKDFEVRIETKTDEVKSSHSVALRNMKLYGLDTAYAARTGGSFNSPQLSLADAIRFSSMQIRGKAPFDNGTLTVIHDFAAELIDVTVNLIINLDNAGSKPTAQCEVVGWRTLDFAILPWQIPLRERFGYQALVTGYIINEVPPRIIEHLSKVLKPVVNNENSKLDEKDFRGTSSEREYLKNKLNYYDNEKNDQENDKDYQHYVKDDKIDKNNDDNEDDQPSDKGINDQSSDEDFDSDHEDIENCAEYDHPCNKGICDTSSDDESSDKDVVNDDTNLKEKDDQISERDDQKDKKSELLDDIISNDSNEGFFSEDGRQKVIILADSTKKKVFTGKQSDKPIESGMDSDKVQEQLKGGKGLGGFGWVFTESETKENPKNRLIKRTGNINKRSKVLKTNRTYNKDKSEKIQQRLNKTMLNRKNNNTNKHPKLTFTKISRVSNKNESTKNLAFKKENVQVKGVTNITRMPSIPHMSENEIH